MSADDWIAALRAECARTSQIDVARRLGVSNTMVNQVLKGTYKGNWTGIETRFKGGVSGADRCLSRTRRYFHPQVPGLAGQALRHHQLIAHDDVHGMPRMPESEEQIMNDHSTQSSPESLDELLASSSDSNRRNYARRLNEDGEGKIQRAMQLAGVLAELCNQAADYSDRIDLSVYGLQAGYEAIMDILSSVPDADERSEEIDAMKQQGGKPTAEVAQP